jgi:UPF0716 protein FxsA
MQLGILLLLAAFPILELVLLIKLGQAIGLWMTLALIFGTAIAGGLVIQAQGMAIVARMREILAGLGSAPNFDIGPSLVLLAGVLLILPGPMTDLAGLVLLLPPVRRWISGRVAPHVHVYRSNDFEAAAGRAEGPPPPPGDGPIIEGEFERIDERTVRRPPRPPQDSASG